METLAIFAAALAAIWFPHVVRGIMTRARYAARSRYGYTNKTPACIDTRNNTRA